VFGFTLLLHTMAVQPTTERIIFIGSKGVPVLACSAVDGVVAFVQSVQAAHIFQLRDAFSVSFS